MPERTIKHLSFRFTDGDGNEQTALQGATVDLSKDEAARGDALGAFTTAKADEPAAVTFDASTADDAALAAWIKDEKPKVAEVLEAAGSDPDLAKRLLDAENAATGGDPRRGVVDGLAAVAGRAQ